MFGIIILNGDRPDIVLDDGTLYGGLHCGDCFRYNDGKWIDVRLEYENDWVLVYRGQHLPVKYGVQVQL